MTYEEFKMKHIQQMMIKLFEEHPIAIQTDRFRSEESSIDDGGNIRIDLGTQFE